MQSEGHRSYWKVKILKIQEFWLLRLLLKKNVLFLPELPRVTLLMFLVMIFWDLEKGDQELFDQLHGDIFNDRAIYGHFPLIVCLQITTFVEVSLQLKQYQNCQQKIFVADLQNEFFFQQE